MLIVPVLLAFLPTQAGAAAEDALMAPQQMRVPGFGETDVARNAALITIEQPTAVAVVTFDGNTEVLTPATLEVVQGITIARLPLQPALTDVTVRLDFGGGFSEDMTWTTGNALIDGPAEPAEVTRAEVESPFLENPHVEIEVAADADLAAGVLSAVDGTQRTRLSASVVLGPTTPLFFADWSYQGGTQDYDVVAIDRAGNVADATPVTVSQTGCAATPAAPLGALALVLLAARRRYTRRPWASSTAG
ncbi:MAG: hypothetical protein A2138_17815 [Deltaproteobacteria bacterium RBG_16_71_12]|nr:MAG: hypothetical protein A2138_17815 [Deltaproteobacteria bacterium RBG_16_71_12]